MYLFTQLCKMMILATFFPTTEVSSGSLDVIGVSEFLNSACVCNYPLTFWGKKTLKVGDHVILPVCASVCLCFNVLIHFRAIDLNMDICL